MFIRSRLKVFMAFAIAVVCAGVVVACDGDRPTGSVAVVDVRVRPTVRDLSAPVPLSMPGTEASARLSRARASTAWVSDIHTAALTDLNSNRRTFMTNEMNKNQRICNAAARLTAKYAPQTYARAGLSASPEETRRQVALAVGRLKLCRSVSQMSIFAATPLLPSAAVEIPRVGADTEPDVTSAYADYVNALQPAYAGSGGSSSDAASAFSPILSSGASSLPEQDYAVLIAAADLGVSSVSYWTTEASGGGYSCPPEGCEEPEMMFRTTPIVWAIVIYVGGSDLIGCAAGAASSWASGARKGGQLAAQCAIWGIAGSAVAGLSLLI